MLSIPPSRFAVDERREDTLCVVRRDESTWQVYYEERGTQRDSELYGSEDAACAGFVAALCSVPSISDPPSSMSLEMREFWEDRGYVLDDNGDWHGDQISTGFQRNRLSSDLIREVLILGGISDSRYCIGRAKYRSYCITEQPDGFWHIFYDGDKNRQDFATFKNERHAVIDFIGRVFKDPETRAV